ncbi:MAG: hypothetical protein A2268_02120 [Candidatus Raymondbacteria bacterium RifOxyA12_full_50_37]|uniref:Lysylphosphatidylglycerol synthetase n=1 Tax=Candidatus Raymondbacteria bacterium RIFOXYD12_FULL_49_13 TaxID=1817890 RepID=A0A1F7F4M8_UNCRA|nr:MAG: hypothetical protein A2268_02120 [Candidatus Raymondbacteria bacterium RifOxyA12_full_50_37]OGJ92224.1 MAG: hypothetical protein A2248_10950 [Candidatus Raymondbacteria bacterium RIFOXYA2_FULL_49_16]OGJ98550.1 MAG: hypothetical protein A2453_06750 [Candidatus Raymondbacteria bacterium RIFOXYC2_FULL_50_21]OGK01591.1 MAG: hypothetical protein A2519_05980 [Candidatus Raymondbacteria bacterium RIFOXYD12_FULL_49_13]OGP44219.1 MAG: hypothetical protein A2324_06875 [Candidatus Raymondbacteria 
MPRRRIIIVLGVACVLALSAGYFVRELARNWNAFRATLDLASPIYIAVGIALMCAGLIFATWQWHFAFNFFSSKKKLRFSESYFLTNAALLGKYFPGRIGHVGVQTLLLLKRGVPPSFSVFVTMLATLLGFFMALITGLALIGFAPQMQAYSGFIFGALCAICFGAVVLFKVYPRLFNVIASLIKRFLHKEVAYVPVSVSFIVRYAFICLGYLAAYLLAMYFACKGAGVELTKETLLLVLGASLISEIIGIIVIVVPGGIGVRESALFLILQTTLPVNVSLAVPLATRMVLLAAELIIAISVIPQRRYWRSQLST